MKDFRSKKVAIVANCILNQNSKVIGFANNKGMVKEIVDLLYEYNYGILQLPCPETLFAGARRWWQVRDQYDTEGYREHCRMLAKPIITMLKEYQKEGYDVVLIGVDGSPSCGINLSPTSKKWGGPPTLRDEDAWNAEMVNKPGIFMEVLMEEIKKAGLKEPKVIGVGLDLKDAEHWNSEEITNIIAELKEKLSK
ncbi:CD3072 family TudS-related putative desulfidase [Acidianus sp.]|uniref:CD3072 family TudS-related putative desulfidase n=1 Tax=Acidianus sp. TaxID=1872104 RepID=UPI00397BCBDE